LKNEVKRSGAGGKRLVRGFRTGGIKGLNVIVTHGNDNLEYLSNLQSRADFFDVSLTHCDGTVYAGSMQFTDDITFDIVGQLQNKFSGMGNAQTLRIVHTV
jgi:hypothetical protein